MTEINLRIANGHTQHTILGKDLVLGREGGGAGC
jgi:hypothetical protein